MARAPQQQEPAVNPAPAATELADVLTRHVSEDLRVKQPEPFRDGYAPASPERADGFGRAAS
jgi:hypothetical protein